MKDAQHLKNDYLGYMKKYSDATCNPPLPLLLFAWIKVTAFSKDCLIRQSSVSQGPAAVVRLVSAPLPLLVRCILFVLVQ